ncbi:hypothetical protein KQI89_17450 [Clostridium sp. MSJ-4]|uniref:Uncharacterized protein n=1 Tax=Clostridium simiarum TaxID=2841506 RepID=A0ABS6F4V7_9CLOT|nr:hypothetical protein [Clostridium simiarum]MBU5593518.1 hypothetical protein [Clostridium simiarum]
MDFTKIIENRETLLTISAEADKNISRDLERYTIPEYKWAIFTVKSSLRGNTQQIDEI